MNLNVAESWKHAIAESAEWRQRQALFQQQQDRARRKAEAENKLDSDFEELATAVLASQSEITEFKAELHLYDTATIEALEANRVELDAVNEEILAMQAEAYVLDDGRRVYKTEDGLRVFDESGTEIAPETLSAEEIPDFHTRWEPYKARADLRESLEEQRDGLHAYQERLDAARDRLDDDDLTKSELDELKDDLAIEMPDAVKRHLPGYEEPQMPDLARSFGKMATPVLDTVIPAQRFEALNL